MSRIKSETIYRIDHIPGDEVEIIDEQEGIQSYHEYDESGRLILEIAYTRDGEIADKTEFRYNEAGNPLETLIYGEDNEVLERKEIIWGDQRIRQEIIHYMDGSEDIHDFFYDDLGNLTGISVKDDEDELEFTENYFYEDGKLVKIERRDEDDELIFSQEDEYENGNLKIRKIWSVEEEEPYTIIQHFNERGHRVEELRYNADDELVERNIFEEDEQGRVARTIEENKRIKNTTEFSFDDNGKVIYQKEIDLNGELNHEAWRYYDPEGEPVKTTVEAVIKSSGEKRAYSLLYQRKYY